MRLGFVGHMVPHGTQVGGWWCLRAGLSLLTKLHLSIVIIIIKVAVYLKWTSNKLVTTIVAGFSVFSHNTPAARKDTWYRGIWDSLQHHVGITGVQHARPLGAP